jgi:hypothetical protein
LKDQNAQYQGRYEYLKDIQRIEWLSKELINYESGFAIFLTNDHLYWDDSGNETNDRAFYLTQGIVKNRNYGLG